MFVTTGLEDRDVYGTIRALFDLRMGSLKEAHFLINEVSSFCRSCVLAMVYTLNSKLKRCVPFFTPKQKKGRNIVRSPLPLSYVFGVLSEECRKCPELEVYRLCYLSDGKENIWPALLASRCHLFNIPDVARDVAPLLIVQGVSLRKTKQK